MKRALGALVWAAALALGIAAEAVAFDWQDLRSWVPDLLTGLALIACGLLAWQLDGRAGAGGLLTATGVAWFAGTVDTSLLYLHRGPLVHLLITYPGWRPHGRLAASAIACGYACALWAAVWESDAVTVGLCLGLLVLLVVLHRGARGRRRHERLTALAAGIVLVVVLAGGAAARTVQSSAEANQAVLAAYELALVSIAVWLLVRLRTTAPAAVTDLVVDLGEAEAGTLRDGLSRTLGDPGLQVGYWSPSTGDYADERGGVVRLPAEGGPRAVTFVERDGRPFAVLVHAADALADPAVAEAVAAATRLTASHALLRAEAEAQAAELAASGRRLLIAGDEARQGLEERLRAGPTRRLGALARTLADVDGAEGARGHLAGTLEDLRALARGLHPRLLVDQGLPAALAEVAGRSPVPVDLDVTDRALPAEVAATVYFVCAEALANVAKYAGAERVRMVVSASGPFLTVEVVDDGVGGADSTRGSGLQGLQDRVAALEGSLVVRSLPGTGTRLTARIPLGGEARSHVVAT